MDDDWDLHAVVKGCCAAGTTATTTVNTSTDHQNPFPSFSSINFHDDQISFETFHGNIDHDYGKDSFQGLHEIYQELCGHPPPSAAVIPAAPVLQPYHQEVMQLQPSYSNYSHVPVMNSQPIRSRRRKNQQTKMVREMTQEELLADSWAWRKYGQKPIKGSPYPRNYYRCSTSKGCAARKQVEGSPTDPGIFIVSYSGEHTHPRPTHRSSLAGSTRAKFSTTRNNNNTRSNLLQKGSINISYSSPCGSSFSPGTPLMDGEVAAQNHHVEVVEEDMDGGGDHEDDDDENNFMDISNDHDLVNDDHGDMFKGFQDSDDHDSSGGGGDLFSSGLLSSPPWTAASSAVNGGGSCG